MLNIDFNPLDVESVWTGGIIQEEELESKVRQLVQEMLGYGLCVPAYMVTEALERYDIDYIALPQYLKDEIDTINVF